MLYFFSSPVVIANVIDFVLGFVICFVVLVDVTVKKQ